MKEKKIAIMAWAVMLSASVFADVYYNNKTFNSSETTSEKVYIGHADGEGDSANALVTIKNGATWTAGNYVSVGCVDGESSFLKIEKGGTFTSTSVLVIGGTSGATGIVTNEGTANVAQIYMAPHGRYDLDKKAGWQYKSARFDNFGVLNISAMLLVGQCVPSTTDVEAESSVFYNHSGATLNLKRGSGEALGIGRRSPGRVLK
ncbi:MAG: hypothetical protein J6N18_00310, partial [Kiritimatiellae bacterium]|nr:hypothetical protein [Kiritimatiellia bacterium]